MKTTIVLPILILAVFSTAFAQRVSITANISKFNIDKIEDEVADIDYAGSTSLTANLRLYTRNKWAFRVGAGLDNLNYSVNGNLTTDYKAKRDDLKGIFGIEKHFVIGKWLDIYPGAFVPVVITGDDIIENNLDNIENGDLRAGLGVLLGGNVSVLKFLRLGVEFDATYDNFKNQVRQSAEELSFVPLKGIKPNATFTVGIAF